MTERKTRTYEIEFTDGHKQLQAIYGSPVARAKTARHAAEIVARRLGDDTARDVNGSGTRYQTVICIAGGGMSLGAEFYVRLRPMTLVAKVMPTVKV